MTHNHNDMTMTNHNAMTTMNNDCKTPNDQQINKLVEHERVFERLEEWQFSKSAGGTNNQPSSILHEIEMENSPTEMAMAMSPCGNKWQR